LDAQPGFPRQKFGASLRPALTERHSCGTREGLR
jgi:hypothetical protein